MVPFQVPDSVSAGVAALVDPDDAIVESDEDNNVVSDAGDPGYQGDQRSFETRSDDDSPDAWTGSGSTSYDAPSACR